MEAKYSSKIIEDTAVCMPSMETVYLKRDYEVPEGTTIMVFNPKNISDIDAALAKP